MSSDDLTIRRAPMAFEGEEGPLAIDGLAEGSAEPGRVEREIVPINDTFKWTML
ncbi:hypothetical protein [Novosphingobium pentaromativorans]|uniref:Uncharacterized protein n=1 Tax=Novosphingobium pentaromativorans US6-1 TaxID=1088721 RepID=G6EEP6_9SPHN|nr:hypothetical protein [Novosphingobium pentaromativorans]EHJ60227.1 hypothetical protein NSU_2817 [Novosphingobium pentaromativorans US6-1]